MVRTLGACILLLLYSLQTNAKIEAVVSHTLFYEMSTGTPRQLRPVIETYWQIAPHTLHYMTNENGIVAHVKTDIIFSNADGIIKEDHYILETVPRKNADELSRHSIIDLRRYGLNTGKIKMTFMLTDLKDSLHHFIYTDSFEVSAAPNKTFYSEPQLLDTTIASAANTVFYKNGQQQVPACTNFLDDKKDMLHYYAEIYNISAIPKEDYPLVQNVSITKKETETPAGFFLKTDTIKDGGKTYANGDFDITTLTSGNYYVCMSLVDKNKITVASNCLFFQRMNTHPAPPDTTKKAAVANDTGMENVNVLNLNKTFVGKYTLAEIRAILKMMLPVSDQAGTRTINGFLKKPDDMYMRYFIYNYFSNINKKDPAKAWKEYTNKVKDVNARFTARGVNGYETERGFLYLRYGEPTEIVTVENEPGTLPYEIWQYNILKEISGKEKANAVFLFYKPTQAMSDYRLLHTNVSGEIQNPSWRSYLYTGNQGGTNMNSRAEQYMNGK